MTLDHSPSNPPGRTLAGRLEHASDWLITYILPLGWIGLLTGMFWIGDRALYHKLYYLLLATPTLFATLFRPRDLRTLASSPLIILFVMFSLYIILSLSWSPTDDPVSSLAKRPLYVLVLFFSAGLLAIHAPQRLSTAFRLSAIIAALAALVSLAIFVDKGASDRLSGYGALFNPLLTSHVLGFFLAAWTAHWFQQKSPFSPLPLVSIAILGAAILATGSRTPLLALAISSAWLMLTHWNRRSLVLLALATIGASILFWHAPEVLTARGLSSRPEIWIKAWAQILQSPWFGHGFDAPLSIWIAAHDYAMADPHNMLLAVLYYGGAVGLILWLLIYGYALVFAWRHRKVPLVAGASTLMVFGLAASMTEGGSFLSRPKEHWFLIWIPLAILFASQIMLKSSPEGPRAIAEKA